MLKTLSGHDTLSKTNWDIIESFISTQSWHQKEPALKTDIEDKLLNQTIKYGAFFLGFDFHIDVNGPQLIEINTNAGGFHTLPILYPEKRDEIEKKITNGLIQEFKLAGGGELRSIAIVDDEIEKQFLYNEMKWVASLLNKASIDALLLRPEDLEIREDGLYYEERKIDLIYNRLTDFRLLEARHAEIRKTAEEGTIIITPHPAAYVRIADKRNFLKIKSPLIPETHFLSDRPVEEWFAEKNEWVFKPSDQAGSKGVYRGDKISAAKMRSLPPETLVQKYIPAMKSEQGTKYDIRVYTIETEILGVVGRHYTGQVMEMRSELSGFRRVEIV